MHYVLPADAAVDPLPMPSLPAFVIGYAKWFTDCCFLKITIQNVDPPMPQEETVGASLPRDWNGPFMTAAHATGHSRTPSRPSNWEQY